MTSPEVAPRGSWLWLWLGVRALSTSRRDTLMRAAVSVVAVVVMLIGCSLQPSALARSERMARSLLPLQPAGTATSGLLLAVSSDYIDGDPIEVRRVTVVGSDTPGIVGLRRDVLGGMVVPGPGQLVVSAGLADLLESSPELRRRYPGEVVGRVPDAQLQGPRSLVVWSGVERSALSSEAGWLARRGPTSGADVADNVPTEVAFAMPMLVVGFLVPLLALLALLSTLGGARRERRLAALRLIGLTDRESKRSAAVEAAVVAAVAVTAGLAVFWGLRSWLAPYLPIEGGAWPEDLVLPGARLVAVVVGFPVLAVVASRWGLRSLTTSPLGVERRSVVARPRRWPLLLLVAGALALAVVLTRPPGLTGSPETRARLALAATVLLMTGLAGSVAVVVRRVAASAARRTDSLPVLVAARQVEREPGRATRVAAGLTLMVVASGPLLVFFPLIADASASSLTRLAGLVGEGTLVTTQGPVDGDDAASDARLRQAQWERARAGSASTGSASLALHTVTLGPRATTGTAPDQQVTAVVADCAELGAVTGIDPQACADGLRLVGAAPPAWTGPTTQYVERVGGVRGTVTMVPVGRPFVLPAAPVESAELGVLLDGLASPASLLVPADLLGPAADLDRAARSELTVPASAADLESVRTGLITATAAESLTVGESDEIARRATREFQVVTFVAGVLIVLIAGLATVVSTIEAVSASEGERRLLHLGGASERLLDRSLLVRALAPSVIGVLPASVASVALAGAYASLLRYAEIPIPLGAIVAVAAASLAAPAVAVAVVGRIYRTGSLTLVGE